MSPSVFDELVLSCARATVAMGTVRPGANWPPAADAPTLPEVLAVAAGLAAAIGAASGRLSAYVSAQDELSGTEAVTAPDPALQAAAAELWQADQLSAQLADVLTAAGAAARTAAGPCESTGHQGLIGDRAGP